MDTESLQKSLIDMRESLRVFRFEGEGSRTRNVRAGRNTRREIARVLTELNARNTVAKADAARTAKVAPEQKKA